MEYRIKDVCNSLKCGVSKFYNLKNKLDNSIPEQNRTEYYYSVGRNVFITEKGLNWFRTNVSDFSSNINQSKCENIENNSIIVYQNQIIEMYKQENEYLKQENKRLLDIVSIKEQKELARDIKYINNSTKNNNISFWDKLFNKFKNKVD